MASSAEATEKVLHALEAWADDLPADQRSALQDILVLAAYGAEVAAGPADEVTGFGYADSEIYTTQLQSYLSQRQLALNLTRNVLASYRSSTSSILGNIGT